MGFQVKKPVEVYVDNLGAIFMANNRSATTRTKHIDLRKHFVNDLVEKGIVKVDFVKSEENVSDIWTKNVSGKLFKKHVTGLVNNDVTESIQRKGVRYPE